MRPEGLDGLEPVDAHRLGGGASFLITCDHAGLLVPPALGHLGLPD